jgi:colicin import membrane protein
MKNYYDLLEITTDTPIEIIEAVYQALVKENGNTTELDNAYTVLSDPIKRKEYDENLEKSENSVISQDSVEEPSKGSRKSKSIYYSIASLVLIGVTGFFVNKYQIVKLPDFPELELSKTEVEISPVVKIPEQKTSVVTEKQPDTSQELANKETEEKEINNKIELDNRLAEEKAKNEALEKELQKQKQEQEEIKKAEIDKLLAEEKAKNEELLQKLEKEKELHEEAKRIAEIETTKKEQIETEKAKALEEEKINNAEKLAQERAKKIEQERLLEAERIKKLEAEKLLAEQKARNDELAKQVALNKAKEKSIADIEQKVTQNWKDLLENADFSLLSHDVVSKLKCKISATISPNGKVLDIAIQKGSDYAGFDQIAEKAISSASPFVIPDNEMLFEKNFKKITFIFDKNKASIQN